MKRMRPKLFSAILIALIFLGVFPLTAQAAPSAEAVIGNSYTLESGQTLNDNLFVLGGNVSLMNGSIINGNVAVIGGSIQAAGTIHGNLFVLGGTLDLASSFLMNGNLTTGGTVVNRAPGAQINGQINSTGNYPTLIIPGQVQIPDLNNNLNPVFKVVGFFLGLFLWVLVAMVLAMFIPNHLSRITQTLLTQPLLSGGLGLLTIFIGPIILVLLAITICLIPVSLIGALLLVVALAYGLIAVGFELGKRISAMFSREWHPAITAGLGTLFLMLVLNGMEAIIPCVGWIPKALVSLFGLGAVLLTQFGMKTYNPIPSLPPSSPEGTLPG